MISAGGGSRCVRAAWSVLAGTVALLLAGCSGSRSSHSDSAVPASARHPARIVVANRPLHVVAHQYDIEGAVVDSHDPRLLRVRYAVLRDGGKPPCAPAVRPFAYVERQDAQSVTVDIAGYRPAIPSGSPGKAVTCDATIVGYRFLPVRLSAPLGSRALHGPYSRGAVAVLPRDLPPAPGDVPAHYLSAAPSFSESGTGERRYRHGRWELDISTDPIIAPGRANCRVDGHPAHLDRTGEYRDVSWRADGRVFEVADYLANQRVAGGYVTGEPPDISVAELLRVARSIG